MTSYEPQAPPAPSSKRPINLLRGWPHPSLLPAEQIRRAASKALSDPATFTPGLLYGPDPGYQPLRESIAQWLSGFYQPKEPVAAGRLCITGGASQNLGSVMDVYTDSEYTRCVWIVAPAYFLAFRIFEDVGLEMRAVPEDEGGVDIAFLQREIEKVEQEERTKQRQRSKKDRPWAKTYKHVIYCVPTFANPSSRTMTLQKRKDLVHLARKYDALVISDDVYDFLQNPTPTNPATSGIEIAALPRLVDLDRTLPGVAEDGFGNTCSNGSFSKIAGPGIRVGWCEGTAKFAHGVSQVGTTKSGGAPSQLTSTYVNILLEERTLQKHIEEVLRPAYRRRCGMLTGAVEKELVPLGFGLPERNEVMKDVQGGYFTWLTLPSTLTGDGEKSAAEVLAERCLAEESVIIAPGKIFEVPGDGSATFGHCVRLCWSWEDEKVLEEGVRRMAKVTETMLREPKDPSLRKGYVLVERHGLDDAVERFR